MKKTTKNQSKGITLIALVITIIVLLILAGVTIATLTGENGLLSNANKAVREYSEAQAKEEVELAIADLTMAYHQGEDVQANETLNAYLQRKLNGYTTETGATITCDSDGKIVYTKDGVSTNMTMDANGKVTVDGTSEVPNEKPYTPLAVILKGSSLSNIDGNISNPATSISDSAIKQVLETDADKGIVIKDVNDNEWVWVEVPKTIYASKVTATDYDGIYNALNTYASTYRNGSSGQTYYWVDEWYDGCGLSSEQYDINYKKMLSSVFSNGGFWIARYESGIEGSDTDISLARTSKDQLVTVDAVSRKDMIPYNYVTCSQAQTLASAMSPDAIKTSSLMFGIQWDLVCKFLEVNTDLDVKDINTDSTSWGNYSNSTFNIDSQNAKKYSTWESITGEKSGSILLTTGASETTNKMNIYDFAGNQYEWTLEHATSDSSYPCASRGNNFNSNGSYDAASYRGVDSTTYSGNNNAFRSVLY